MLHWQLSAKHKFFIQLFGCAVVGHLIGLFLLFFVYRGELYERRLTLTIPLDVPIVLLPFQKSVLAQGGKLAQRNSAGAVKGGLHEQALPEPEPIEQKSEPEPESSKVAKTEEPPLPDAQRTILDNGTLERKKQARERELKHKKKLAREKKERAAKEKQKRELAKAKAAESKKKKLEQKALKEIEKKKEPEGIVQPQLPAAQPISTSDSAQPELLGGSEQSGGEGNSPFYVGQYDLETLQLAQTIAAEVAQVWRPPSGFKNKSCIVRCVLDWEGVITALTFEEPSGSAVFDISVKQAITKMKFPRELYGKEIVLPFTA